MFKGLTHVANGSYDYFYCGLEHPLDGYETWNRVLEAMQVVKAIIPLTAQVKISIPEKIIRYI